MHLFLRISNSDANRVYRVPYLTCRILKTQSFEMSHLVFQKFQISYPKCRGTYERIWKT